MSQFARHTAVYGSRFLLTTLLLGGVWLEGVICNVVRPVSWPDVGEVVNGIWVFCDFSGDHFERIRRFITYPLLVLFSAAFNYKMITLILKSSCSFKPMLALIAFFMVLGAASFRYGGTSLPSSDGSNVYAWKWLGVTVQETMADCN